MKRPLMREYDNWRRSSVGQWFFEHYLQEYADEGARLNGRQIGQMEYDVCVRNAGVIEGVEYAITADPFEEERDEAESRRETGTGPVGL